LRIDRQRAPEIGLRLDIVRLVLQVMMEHASLIELIGILIVLRLVGDAVAFEFQEFRLKRTRDNAGDLVLQFEQVGEVAVESLGHYVMAGVSTDQLRRDPYAVAGFAYAALDDVARAELLSDRLDVDCFAFEGERRIPGDHWKCPPTGEH
jgi:hypothetical protein